MTFSPNGWRCARPADQRAPRTVPIRSQRHSLACRNLRGDLGCGTGSTMRSVGPRPARASAGGWLTMTLACWRTRPRARADLLIEARTTTSCATRWRDGSI
jgi:hypothetical protein